MPVEKLYTVPKNTALAFILNPPFILTARGRTITSVKHLYLPVESLARELDGKLLLALVARERGWRPVIGSKRAIRERQSIFPSGIYFAHTARRINSNFFGKFSRYGHQSTVLDEEALVRQTDDIFLMKHKKDAFDNVNLLLTWGEDDAQLWRKSRLVGAECVVVTGNPRMDVLRRELRAFHQPEIDSIRERFDDYVLLNTNFPTVNHYVSWLSTLELAKSVTDKGIIEQKSEFLRHKQALFERFQLLVPKIAQAIAPLRLIVRPHPSERHEPWLDAVSRCPNASVVREGSVVPWIAGARALVHNGCTSAVESAVIGTTVLSYRAVQSDIFDNPLPNGLGIECFDDDTLIRELQAVLDSAPRPLTPDQSRLLEHHVASTSGRLSCERIIDAFDKLSVAGEPVGDFRKFEWFKRYVAFQLRAKSWRIKDALTARGRTRRKYAEHQFPEITPHYLNDRIGRFQLSLDRFHGQRAKRLATNLFAIE